MRYRRRTLAIALTVMPPLLAAAWLWYRQFLVSPGRCGAHMDDGERRAAADFRPCRSSLAASLA